MFMNKVFEITTYIYDPLHTAWSRQSTHSRVSAALVVSFLLALAGIECNRQGLLPQPWAGMLPTNHFHAVNLAFSLVLILEVIGLIFVLPCSVSRALGKQFEIIALILLRNAFKELVYFSEPVAVMPELTHVYEIVAYGAGALAVFLLLGVYNRLQRKRKEIREGQDLFRFVALKKLVALVMLLVFVGLGVTSLVRLLSGGHPHFFPTIYTILIFSDILLVLISQCFLPAFHAVFRNSGYALSTLLMRIALTAPVYYDILMIIVSAGLAVLLTLIYNFFYAPRKD